MRRPFLLTVGLLVSLIAVDGVLAQGQGQREGNASRREMPPVRMPRQKPERRVDANETAKRAQMRQEMREQASRHHRQADQNAVNINMPGAKDKRKTGAGEQYKQEMKNVKQQMAKELAKRRERVARLSRIRELAQQQGDAETVSRVDKLLEKDRWRHEAKTQIMERRKNAITKFMEKADVNKP